MTRAEDYRGMRDWVLENAGLEAQSLPIAIQILWMMDSYLEAAINETAAQVAGLPAEGECLLSPSPPAEGECLLSLPPPAEGECLLVLPPQPKWEEPERPQPKREEPERPQPKREEPERPQPKWEEPEHPTLLGGRRAGCWCPPAASIYAAEGSTACTSPAATAEGASTATASL
ncbi:UNVERIFIED_CONTAM: hypothetical protein FKN15_020967 [Acipenser sinensis]